MERKVLVPVSQGTEEMEAVIIIDMLRRAGIRVIVAGDNSIITCSRKVKLLPDVLIEDLPEEVIYDAIVIPGGATGAKNLSENDILERIIKKHAAENKILAAICAAPTVLDIFKVLPADCKLTSHPSVKGQMSRYNYEKTNVTWHDNIITSRGAGTAFEFALKIIEILKDKETADKIAKDIVFN